MNQNKRIAEFMGLVVSDSANYTSELHTNVDVDLKYHTSWDWLMPVVQKCYNEESEEMNNLGATADISMYLTDVDLSLIHI